MVGYPPPHPQHFVRLLWQVFGTHLHTWARGWIRACQSQGFSPWPGCFNPGSPSYQLSDNCISMTLKCCLTKFYGQVKVVVYCKDAHQFARVGRHWRGYTNKEDVKGCEPQTVEKKELLICKKVFNFYFASDNSQKPVSTPQAVKTPKTGLFTRLF